MKINPVDAYKLGEKVAPKVPPGLAYALCNIVGLLIYLFNRGGRAAVRSNLRHVLGPAASQQLINRFARRVFINNVKNQYDMLRLPALSHKDILKLVEIRDAHYGLDALAQGKGLLLISGHFGNFNIIIQAAVALEKPLSLLVEPIEPPELYEYITGLRHSLGTNFIPVGGPAMREAFRVLRRGEVLGIAADRDVTGSGEVVSFFGAPARMPTGTAEMARRTRAPLVPVYIWRESNNRSVAQLFPPIELSNTGDAERDLANDQRTVIATLEKFVAARPDQWIILQKIWQD